MCVVRAVRQLLLGLVLENSRQRLIIIYRVYLVQDGSRLVSTPSSPTLSVVHSLYTERTFCLENANIHLQSFHHYFPALNAISSGCCFPLEENLCVSLPSPEHAIGSRLDPHLWPSISSLRFVPCRTVHKWSPNGTYKNSVGRAICNISIWRLPKGSPVIEWMRIILIHSHIVLQ